MFKFLPRLVFVTFIFASLQTISYAQLTGIKNIPGDYATLDLAITDLNSQGVGPGGVTLNLIAGNPQTSPAGGYAITATGTLANPINITGNGNTITAPITHTVGALNDAIFKIIGGDYITISSFNMFENPANTITTAATNNMTEWGVALLYVTTTDGAQNNAITGCVIDLDRTYQNTFGIYSNSTHSATNVSTSATASTVTGGNSNLAIYSNQITDVNMGIVVVGPTGSADHNDVLDIGGSSLSTGNTITNYGTTGTFSSYANVSGTVNGILVRNTRNFNISYNTVTSSNGGTVAGTLRGIYVPAFSAAPTGTLVNTISFNNISVRSAVATGTLNGIHVEATTVNATTTLNINNNDINNTTHTIGASGAVNLILNAAAALNTNINNNTFTNLTLNTTGSLTIIGNNVSRPANSVTNVNNNSIVTGLNKTGAGGTVLFYNSNSLTPSTGTENNIGNNFSNMTFTGATTISGWLSTDGSGTAPFGPGKTVSNNTFSNITGGTNSMTILSVAYSNSGLSTNDVTGNTINNISGGGVVTGITSATASQNIYGNTVHTLSSTGASVVTGIALTGGTVQNIYKNKIYNLSTNNSGGSVFAISVGGSTASMTANVYNNLIGELSAPITNLTTDAIRGISVTNTSANGNMNISYNSIHINATSSGTNFSTAGVFHTTSATATTGTLNLRNNVIVNTSTANGTGITSAFRRSSTTLTNYGASSNNNLFYAGTPGPANVIMYDGTTGFQTLAIYQPVVAPRDAASISEVPPFLSTAGVSPNFLHIDPFALSGISNGAVNIAGITDDYDGDIRFGNVGYTGGGTAPDMGADEYNILLALDMGVSMLIEPSITGCHTASDTIRLRINNYSNQTINFSVNPVTVTSSSSGTNPMAFPVLTLNSDTLTAFGFLDTTVFIGYDMTAVGTYTFNATASVAGDGDPSNNSMTPVNIIISGGTASASQTSGFCSGELVDLSVSGQTTGGTIQWQESTDGGFSWNNIVGGNTSPYTISSTNTALYRAEICGSYTSTSVLVEPTVVEEPVANDVVRCGPGPVTLNASGTGIISWFNVPTGGSALDTGSTFTIPLVTSSTTYYVEAATGVNEYVGANSVNDFPNAGTNASFTAGMLFDVLSTDVNIQTVDIYPTSPIGTNFQIVIRSGGGTGPVIATYQGTTTVSGTIPSPVVQTVPVNFTIPNGTGYAMTFFNGPLSPPLTGSGVYPNALRNNPATGVAYPYTIPGVISITNATISNVWYYFYNWKINTGCVSTRDTVNITVTPSDTIIASVVTNPICSNASTAINVNSINPDYQYTWSPAAGLSGTTGSSVTTTSDTSITYLVTAIDTNTNCEAYTYASVTVLEAPTVNITTPDTALCINSTLQINGTSGSHITFNGNVGLGVSTNTATSTTILGPYGGLYGGARHQYLVLGTELQAAGLTAGPISQVAFDVANLNSVAPLADYVVKLDTTSLTALTTSYAPVNNTVYYNPSFMPTLGWNGHPFSNNFMWDGVSNIIVEVCFNNVNAGSASGNASVRYTNTTGTNTVNYYRADNDPNVCAMLSGTPSINRPNMRFSTVASVSYQWSPATGLSNDTIIDPVLTAISTNTYTLLVTDDVNGCSETDNITVTVNPLPVFTIGNDTAVCSNVATTPFGIFASDINLNYLWFDGATTTGTLVNGPGTYWAIGTDVNGCSNSDTMVVSTVDPANVDIDINITGTNTADLDAGAGFSNYLWSTSGNTQMITITGNGTYWVQITDNNGCTNSDTVSIIFSLGIDEMADGQLLFYPNPSTGIINMAGKGLNGDPLKLEIMDISGQMIYEKNIEEPGENFIDLIDLGLVAEGTYVVRVTSGNKIHTTRIIIARK